MRSLSKGGKKTVIAGFFLLFSVMGLLSNCFSMSIVPVTADLGFSRGAYQLSQTVMFCASALFGFFNQKIYRRFDMIKLVRIGTVTATVVFFLQSYATKVWMFYLSYCILGFCMGFSTSLPTALLINEWVDLNAFTWTGIAMMGSGIGGAIFNPLMTSIVQSSGWQVSYRVMALVMGAIAIPSAFLLSYREDKARAEAPKDAPAESRPIPGFQKRVLLICLCLFIGNCFGGCLNFAINPQIQDLGYSAEFASLCSSIEMIVLAAGKIAVGRILDKKGAEKYMYIGLSTTAVSLVCLAFFRPPVALFMILINQGMFFGVPIGTVASVCFAKTIAGEKDFKQVVGMNSLFLSAGAMAAPLFLGNAYDIFGSYTPLLIALAIFLCIFMLFIKKIFAVPLKR